MFRPLAVREGEASEAADTYDQAAGTVKEKTGEPLGDRELQVKSML